MKGILGLFMVLVGILLGLYVGFWLCLVGGIVDFINEIKMPGAITMTGAAIDIIKIISAGFFGWTAALILIFPGIALIVSTS